LCVSYNSATSSLYIDDQNQAGGLMVVLVHEGFEDLDLPWIFFSFSFSFFSNHSMDCCYTSPIPTRDPINIWWVFLHGRQFFVDVCCFLAHSFVTACYNSTFFRTSAKVFPPPHGIGTAFAASSFGGGGGSTVTFFSTGLLGCCFFPFTCFLALLVCGTTYMHR
jgi:hypothetical protein